MKRKIGLILSLVMAFMLVFGTSVSAYTPPEPGSGGVTVTLVGISTNATGDIYIGDTITIYGSAYAYAWSEVDGDWYTHEEEAEATAEAWYTVTNPSAVVVESDYVLGHDHDDSTNYWGDVDADAAADLVNWSVEIVVDEAGVWEVAQGAEGSYTWFYKTRTGSGTWWDPYVYTDHTWSYSYPDDELLTFTVLDLEEEEGEPEEEEPTPEVYIAPPPDFSFGTIWGYPAQVYYTGTSLPNVSAWGTYGGTQYLFKFASGTVVTGSKHLFLASVSGNDLYFSMCSENTTFSIPVEVFTGTGNMYNFTTGKWSGEWTKAGQITEIIDKHATIN